jgi:polyisoprenoid-binding protein YceI
MKRLILLAAALGLLGCASLAGKTVTAEPTPASTAVADTPVDVAGGDYNLDSRHVSVIWRVRHMGQSLYTARFDKVSGALSFDAGAPAKSALSVAIETDSVSTGLRDKDGKLSFDAAIAKGLGAEKSPQITFVSKSITRTGEKTATIQGDLTMNGVTKPATLEAAFEAYNKANLLSGKPVLAFSGHAVIKRSDWGVTAFSLFAADDVEIIIQVEFDKA